MLRKHMLILSFFSLAGFIGCANNDTNPISNSGHEPFSNQAIAPQAFPNQTGELDSGYYLGNKIYYFRINGRNVFQGDIVLSDNQISKSEGLSKSTGAISTAKLWPNSTVFYTIDATVLNQARIRNAITNIQMRTNLVFTPRTTQVNFIRFIFVHDSEGCYSNGIGMSGGGNDLIHLAGWGTTGIAIHEIGHKVSLLHEHTRTDGDNINIKIVWANINHTANNDWWPHFYAFSNPLSAVFNTNGANNGAYDFNSIMHYPCFCAAPAAINPNSPIITRLNGTTWTVNMTSLSNGDIAAINFIYGPSRAQNRGASLTSGQFLRNNEFLQSTNGRYRLYMQTDGNLVLYNWITMRAIWRSQTNTKPVILANMQPDGNFVLYDINNVWYFRTNTQGNPGAHLDLQTDGNLVLYNSSGAWKWRTNTAGL